MIFAELNWHSISTGMLTEKEINKMQFEIKSRKQKSLKKHIPSTIPNNEKYRQKAEETATMYFNNFYPMQGNTP